MRPAETSSFAARRTSASGIPAGSSLIHVNLGELLQSRNTKVRFGGTPKPARETRALPIHVNFCALLDKLGRFFLQPFFQRFAFGDPLLCGVLADILCDVDELRLPANLALRVTLNVIYPTLPLNVVFMD